MAGKIVYQGELFEDLGIKLENMVASMEAQTIELGIVADKMTAVAANTSQSINSLKIEKSDDLKGTYNVADKGDTTLITAVSTGSEFEIGRFTSFAAGTVRIELSGMWARRYNSTYGNMTAKVYAKVTTQFTGLPVVSVASDVTVVEISGKVDIPVSAGDVVIFGMLLIPTSGTTASRATCSIVNNVTKVSYKLLDMIDTSAFILL